MKRSLVPFAALAHLIVLAIPLLAKGDEPAGPNVAAIQERHDRALIKDLMTYVAANPKAEDVELAYMNVFNKAIDHDWFAEHETFAKKYLGDNPEGNVRSLAQIVVTMARAGAGSYDEALAVYTELLAGLGSSDQLEFAANFAENLATRATADASFEVARKVYAGLLKRFGDQSTELKQKVAEAVARLDRVGKEAPTQEVKDFDGKSFKFADLKGKYVLVDFWATWCGPCIAELPRVQAAYEKYKGKGLEVVAISLDETKPAAVDFVKERKLTWRQIHNPSSSGDLAAEFGVTTIPATYLIDPTGKIVRLELRGEALDKALAALFK